VRRGVIDVKKISSTARRPLSKLISQGKGKGVFLNGGTILFNPSGQPLIGFSQRGFNKRMKRTNTHFEPGHKPELKESGTTRGNRSRIRGSTEPKDP
jgi:hypothetical protein